MPQRLRRVRDCPAVRSFGPGTRSVGFGQEVIQASHLGHVRGASEGHASTHRWASTRARVRFRRVGGRTWKGPTVGRRCRGGTGDPPVGPAHANVLMPRHDGAPNGCSADFLTCALPSWRRSGLPFPDRPEGRRPLNLPTIGLIDMEVIPARTSSSVQAEPPHLCRRGVRASGVTPPRSASDRRPGAAARWTNTVASPAATAIDTMPRRKTQRPRRR